MYHFVLKMKEKTLISMLKKEKEPGEAWNGVSKSFKWHHHIHQDFFSFKLSSLNTQFLKKRKEQLICLNQRMNIIHRCVGRQTGGLNIFNKVFYLILYNLRSVMNVWEGLSSKMKSTNSTLSKHSSLKLFKQMFYHVFVDYFQIIPV